MRSSLSYRTVFLTSLKYLLRRAGELPENFLLFTLLNHRKAGTGPVPRTAPVLFDNAVFTWKGTITLRGLPLRVAVPGTMMRIFPDN
jgi:hypothetical protein